MSDYCECFGHIFNIEEFCTTCGKERKKMYFKRRKEQRIVVKLFADSSLKKRRKELGLSMGEVARRAEISTVFYREVEMGLKSLSDHTAAKISRALKIAEGSDK